ncbi:hypothetical protein C8Q74DRAFT_891992 [Fomes fomentarius]|nr:hypothetical protein C8Q74DRAFT_891992 [Fomes fomentarius]
MSLWWLSASDTAVSRDSTLGVLLMATVLASMGYGITILQTLQYYDRYYNDSRALKFLVLVLGLFETTTIVTEIHALYFYSVTYAGGKLASIPVPSSLPLERSFFYAAIFLVQIFLAVRIQQLGRRYWWLAVIAVSSEFPTYSWTLV